VAAFERAVSDELGLPHGLMVNSGSSANLLALIAGGYEPGDGVLTPALTFGTTVAPILHTGLVPQYVDADPDTYQIDINGLEAAATDRTRAVLVPLLLGNVPDLTAIHRFCARRGLDLILDSCDTLGARWKGAPVGEAADAVTTSFYASHIITAAGGGGLVAFRDEAGHDRARLLAYWGRASNLGDGDDILARYADGYDLKFMFPAAGFNLQPTEVQGAFGLAQMKTLSDRQRTRARHWRRLFDVFGRWPDYFARPKVLRSAEPHWLAFPVRVLDAAPFTRRDMAIHLESVGIETRPVMTGNILRQPGFRDEGADAFPGADTVMRQGLLLGCHQGLGPADLAYMEQHVAQFVASSELDHAA
jgi:CDP-6-deoxy-D-xylo-4-hexulose-3-dehydrase